MKRILLFILLLPFLSKSQTLTFACGWEEQYINSVQTDAHWTTNGAANTDFSTTTVRTGAAAGRSHPSAAGTAALQWNNLTASQTYVIRVFVRFATLPNADVNIVSFRNGTADEGVFFKVSDSKLYPGYGLSGTNTFGSGGTSVTTGQWYMIDLKVVATGNPHTIDVKVDGSALTQLTRAVAAANYAAFYCGNDNSSSVTMDVFFDDLAVSVTGGDYPIGDGFVWGYVPTSDGTHNVAGSNDFERTGTGTDILNATTDAYLLVDEVPFDGAGATDYILCLAPPNATDYVEVVWGPMSGSSAPSAAAPRGVEIMCAIGEVSAGTNNIRLGMNDANTITDLFNGDPSGGHQNVRTFIRDPPSAATLWTLSGNGNFNNFRMRVYSSDAAPDTYWIGGFMEAEFAPISASPRRVNFISSIKNIYKLNDGYTYSKTINQSK